MAIHIKKISDIEYRVGEKIVYEDTDGRLIARTELTTEEANAFYNFVGRRSLNTLSKSKVNHV